MNEASCSYFPGVPKLRWAIKSDISRASKRGHETPLLFICSSILGP